MFLPYKIEAGGIGYIKLLKSADQNGGPLENKSTKLEVLGLSENSEVIFNF
jgi:hypothetical protein